MRLPRVLAWVWLISWFGGSALHSLLFDSPPFSIQNSLAPPKFPSLLLGADTYGRDLLPLLSGAAFLSFSFAVCCVGTSVLIAMTLAGLAPNLPRSGERLMETTLHFLLGFPSILFALMIGGFLGPGRLTVAIALVLGSAPGLTRALWTRAREISAQEFVWAARSLGASPIRMAVRHYFPFLISITRVKLPSMLAHALLAETSLSFMGLGFPVGEESWGSLLAQAKDYLIEAPHISISVGAPLVLSLLALDFVSKSSSDKLM